MSKFRGLSLHKKKIDPTLSKFSILPFLPFPISLSQYMCVSQYMCGHNLTMKFQPDFQNFRALNGIVNSCS